MSGEHVHLALVIEHSGDLCQKILPSDADARIAELRDLLGCNSLETVPMPEGQYFVIDAEAKGGLHFINGPATRLAHEAESISKQDYIAGRAILVSRDAIA